MSEAEAFDPGWRRRVVAARIRQGEGYRSIAQALGVNPKTVVADVAFLRESGRLRHGARYPQRGGAR